MPASSASRQENISSSPTHHSNKGHVDPVGTIPSLLAIPLAMSVPSSATSFRPCGLLRRHHEFSSYTNTSPDELATAASLSVPLISVSSFSNEGTTVTLGAGNDFDLVASSSSSSSVQSPLSPSGIPVRSGQYRTLYESFVSTRSRVVQVREGIPIDATRVR